MSGQLPGAQHVHALGHALDVRKKVQGRREEDVVASQVEEERSNAAQVGREEQAAAFRLVVRDAKGAPAGAKSGERAVRECAAEALHNAVARQDLADPVGEERVACQCQDAAVRVTVDSEVVEGADVDLR